jgi:hypothetical protein
LSLPTIFAGWFADVKCGAIKENRL